ncbi:lantibiotic dehydratase [Bernardetia sp. Wsw4-3y2]|uniref:lantibiotic dehydratase n=1 Tax=Bernardetia sp. Wsw4-3y2 TaxID=3127471 RepID=UPI0030D49DF9
MDYFFLRSPLSPLFSENPADELAIFLSSPDFQDTVQQYEEGKLKDKKVEKFLLSKAKYDLRSRFRCTPFGTFAGILAGKLSSNNQGFVHQGIKKYHLSLDMSVLGAWIDKLHQITEFLEVLTFYPNNTLYQFGEDKRYIESYFEGEKARKYAISNIEWNEYLEKIIEFAKEGKKITEIAEQLVDEDISLEEAKEFILEIIEAQILVSDIALKITGEPFEDILRSKLGFYLKNNPQLENIEKYSFIKESFHLLSELKEYYQKNHPKSAELFDFSEKIKSLEIPFKLSSLFQMDTVLKFENPSLHHSIKEEVEKAIDLLKYIYSYQEISTLTSFKEAFSTRYESAEVPLMQVLDPEIGLGFPLRSQANNDNAPLLKGMPLNGGRNSQNPSLQQTRWTQFLQKKFIEALQNKSSVIELTNKELKDEIGYIPEKYRKSKKNKNDTTKSKEDNNIPFSYSSMITVLASSSEAIEEENYKIIHKGTNGSSAVTLLGRFCHADAQTNEYVLDCIQQEEELSDKIFAEIVHLPEARVGNVIARPQLRKYEIPIGVRTAENANSVTLDDIRVSVSEGKIKLRSLKYDKEIIPRMSNAHNYSMTEIPAYHFLSTLQNQNVISGLQFSWQHLNNEPYLPRVEYEKVILSPQKWVVSLKETKIDKKINTEQALEKLRNYFQDRDIPNRLTFGQGDNILPLFTDDDINLTLFWQELKKMQRISVQEMLYNEENLFIKDEEGNGYTNEFIIPHLSPLVKSEQESQSNTATNLDSTLQREYTIGSEWIYFKIYCGVSIADELLIQKLFPLASQLLQDNTITEWFFIRYADPDHHLRIRFKGTNDFYKTVIEKLHENLNELVDNKSVWKIQIDTYQREIERYGSKNMANSELLFHKESQLICSILQNINEDDDLRWKLAFLGVDNLLTNFDLEIGQKKHLMEILSESFHKEFGLENINDTKILSKSYREKRQTIEEIIENPAIYSEYKELLTHYSLSIKENVDKVLQLAKNNELEMSLPNLVASYIHMFLNRYFRANQRKHECIIYYMLFQHYRSAEAKNKASVLAD